MRTRESINRNGGLVRRNRKIKITVETQRIAVIRQARDANLWCQTCAEIARMITVDEAAMLAAVRSMTIYAWAEAHRLHFIETPDGRLLICSNSLHSQSTSENRWPA